VKILMLTNTYKPHVGGVARSVEAFAEEFRRRGHQVRIVAPEFEHASADEREVVRVPALQNFNGSDFAVRLPIPGLVSAALAGFEPDLIHSHHPFLLGETAVRLAAMFNVPLVFQHHTMYERYTHYVPGDSRLLQQFVVELSTEYANLCDGVIAPSESIAIVLRERGVKKPLRVVPTGVDVERFSHGDGMKVRARLGIPAAAFLVGHVGRLAPEKNLLFLAEAVAEFLRRHGAAHWMVCGNGPSEEAMRQACKKRKVAQRVHFAGICTGQDLVDAYHAMDVFAFASHTETQGMVLTEALAAGRPVVALDAPGSREVVRDRRNGRLLHGERRREFAAALEWTAGLNAEQRLQVRQNARRVAEEFAMPRCAERMLDFYQSLILGGKERFEKSGPQATRDDTLWVATLRRFSTEWDLWAAKAHAAQAAVRPRRRLRRPVVGSVMTGLRQFRRWLTRSEWTRRLLGYRPLPGAPTDPGLVLLQIDGLSRKQLEKALQRGRMPFLRRLLRREHYRLHTLYSGVPSTTPAVQGELFYGVSQAVPSFGFRDHASGQIVYMFQPDPAAAVQARLAAQGPGLLEGGSAWSDVFSGGAAESHFSAAAIGWGDLARGFNPFTQGLLLLMHFGSVLRIAGLFLVETVLALTDFVRGLLHGYSLPRELTFVATRVGIVIGLRELLTVGITLDVARGLPIVHANFLGYDEQAHRRGPNSAFAHWALGGIDGAIKRIWHAAHRSSRRDYQFWIYSDHGQESVVHYAQQTGVSIHQAVTRVFEMTPRRDHTARESQRGVQLQRFHWLSRLSFGLIPAADPEEEKIRGQVDVVALGPLAHVYPPEPLSAARREQIACRLIAEAKVPLVLAADGAADAIVWTSRGRFRLPQDAAEVIGADHEFLAEAAKELATLCHHPDAGSLVLSGWRPDGPPLTFPDENGAHAGPGREETRAFALLPKNVRFHGKKWPYLRPADLRHAALQALGRAVADVPTHYCRVRRDTVRLMTYNIHSCIGVDGRISPARVARLIAQCDPDIVALQEVDVRRSRTGNVDQAHAIARELHMEFHFHPALKVKEERYGDAVLSRFPLRVVRAAALPIAARSNHEPRGAIWVAIELDGYELQLINTHLGVTPRERAAQIEALMGQDWLASPAFTDPKVVCGDFNVLPRSAIHRRLCESLCDAQLKLPRHRPRRTFPSRIPLGRIDHVFVGSALEVVSVEVPRSRLARVTSDHLPVVVELRIGQLNKDT
jgi:endonuclease/exonuclease/phosphatase family metal-dependent hydrolase/glycosyltransferase involved in cell wall biosynthesis